MTTRGAMARGFKTAANKKYGPRTVAMGGIEKPLPGPRLTSGSLSLDFVLGGGLLVGTVSLFRGSESSGKTTTAVRIAALAQEICANCYRRPPGGVTVREEVDEETGEVVGVAEATCDCVKTGLYKPFQMEGETEPEFRSRRKAYEENSFEEFRVGYIDVESSLRMDWAARVGLDPRRLVLIHASTAEEAIDLHDEMRRTGAYDLIVLDSLASMTPKDEVEKSATEWQQGLQARLLNKMSRKMYSSRTAVQLDYGRPLTEIWINQERQKIGVAYGDNTVMPGGEGQKFTGAIILKMWASQWEKETVDEDLKKEWQIERGTDVRMNFKAVKNNTAPPQGQGGYRMGVAGDTLGKVLDLDYMAAQAEKFGVLRKESAKWLLGNEEFKTKTALMERMAEPAVRRALRELLVQRMLGL